ncbi:MAG TPA: FecR domain-containing protein [Rhizomicrobium sp.]
MSGTANLESRVTPGTKAIRAAASEWLERQERPDWGAREQAELDAWLGESAAHLTAYWRVEAAWRRTERLAALRSSEAHETSMRRRIRALLGKAAAAVAAVAMLAIGGNFLLRNSHEKVYATQIGGHRTLVLKDGSRIEINTDTILRVSDNDERRAWLDKGEAYFQIIHDAKRPFVVVAGNRRITDLGTKFVIRQDDMHFKVAVLEGLVRLAAKKDDAQSLLLEPGDSAIAKGNSLAVNKAAVSQLANELGWRRGVLVFDNETLGEAANEFNRYNSGKIVVADSAAANLRIVGTFPTNGVDGFVDVAQHILGVRVEKHGNETVISR